MTTRSIAMVGISADLEADCIPVTVPPSTKVLITTAKNAAAIRAWVEIIFMVGPVVWFVAMDRTVGSGTAARERLAMNCVKRALNCKRAFVAKSSLFAVHSGFLSFRRAGRRLVPILASRWRRAHGARFHLSYAGTKRAPGRRSSQIAIETLSRFHSKPLIKAAR